MTLHWCCNGTGLGDTCDATGTTEHSATKHAAETLHGTQQHEARLGGCAGVFGNQTHNAKNELSSRLTSTGRRAEGRKQPRRKSDFKKAVGASECRDKAATSTGNQERK